MTVVAMVAGVLSVPVGGLPSAVAAPGSGLPRVTDEASAAAVARATGAPVEVPDVGSQTRRVFANPDGTFTDKISALPTRVRDSRGDWVAVDTTLRVSPDGLVRPGAAAVDVAFSGGGMSAALVRLGDAGRSLSLGWPSGLPVPSLSGDTATYAEVLPGVDLKVRALADRFSEVLVVKSAAAAANPALAAVRLSVSAVGLSLRTEANGGVSVVDAGGGIVFSAVTPTMWDSTLPVAPAGVAAAGPGADTGMVSSDRGPGYGARRATMPVSVAGGSLSVTPDQGLLTGAGTTYPVFVDPAFGRYGRTAWTEVDQLHPTWTGAIVDGDLAAAGFQNFQPPLTIRTLFHYNLSGTVWGFHILKATLRAHLVWSASHDPSCHYGTVTQSWVTGGFTSATNWNTQPAWTAHQGDMNVIGGNPANPGCPATDVEFNLTPGVAAAAKAHTGINIGLKAANEGDPVAWRKFSNNPELDVDYNHPPNTPTAAGTGMVNPNASCESAPLSRPAHLNVRDRGGVTFKVNAATDMDPNEQLVVRFELWRSAGSAPLSSLPATAAANSGSPFMWRPAYNTTDFPDTSWLYTWRAMVYDLNPTTGAVMDHATAWSPWCYFVLDSVHPEEPTLSSTDFPTTRYGRHAGEEGVVTITPPPGITDLAGYQITVDQGVPRFQPATGIYLARVIVATSGPHQVSVATQDTAGNLSTAAVYSFWADSPTDAVGNWRLNEGTGTSVASLDETDGELPPQAGTLTGGVSWVADSRFGTAPQFDGSSGAIATTLTTVDTNAGFSVTAWVKLADKAHRYVVVSQDGSRTSGFALEYAPAPVDRWRFVMTSADADTNTVLAAASTGSPAVGVWTHLAGVFNADTHTMALFVNGTLHRNQANNAPWDAVGHPIIIGRGQAAGAPSAFLAGQVSEVRVYRRALSYDPGVGAGEVSDVFSHSNAETPTGLWHLDGTSTDAAGTHPLTVGPGGAYAAGQMGSALRLPGTDQGYAVTASAVTNTDRSYTISAWVNLDNIDDGYTVLSQDSDAETPTGPGYALRYDADSDEWTFSMAGFDATGAPAGGRVGVPAHGRVGAWVHLTAMYDGFSHLLWLYETDPSPGGTGIQVDHARQGVPVAATGPLQVGREVVVDGDPQSISYVGALPGAVDEVAAYSGTIPAGRIS